NPTRLQVATATGIYGHRTSVLDLELLYTSQIQVTPIDPTRRSPDLAGAGSVIEIGWAGPGAPGDNIQIGPEGGRYLHFTYVERGNPLRLQMPIDPGTYELRYSFLDREVIYTKPIEVTPIELDIIAPP